MSDDSYSPPWAHKMVHLGTSSSISKCGFLCNHLTYVPSRTKNISSPLCSYLLTWTVCLIIESQIPSTVDSGDSSRQTDISRGLERHLSAHSVHPHTIDVSLARLSRDTALSDWKPRGLLRLLVCFRLWRVFLLLALLFFCSPFRSHYFSLICSLGTCFLCFILSDNWDCEFYGTNGADKASLLPQATGQR